jgi:preprotein translocase subunit SecE
MNKDLMVKIIAYILVAIGFIVFLSIFFSILDSLRQGFIRMWWGK